MLGARAATMLQLVGARAAPAMACARLAQPRRSGPRGRASMRIDPRQVGAPRRGAALADAAGDVDDGLLHRHGCSVRRVRPRRGRRLSAGRPRRGSPSSAVTSPVGQLGRSRSASCRARRRWPRARWRTAQARAWPRSMLCAPVRARASSLADDRRPSCRCLLAPARRARAPWLAAARSSWSEPGGEHHARSARACRRAGGLRRSTPVSGAGRCVAVSAAGGRQRGRAAQRGEHDSCNGDDDQHGHRDHGHGA